MPRTYEKRVDVPTELVRDHVFLAQLAELMERESRNWVDRSYRVSIKDARGTIQEDSFEKAWEQLDLDLYPIYGVTIQCSPRDTPIVWIAHLDMRPTYPNNVSVSAETSAEASALAGMTQDLVEAHA
jgi:hypothetical protein